MKSLAFSRNKKQKDEPAEMRVLPGKLTDPKEGPDREEQEPEQALYSKRTILLTLLGAMLVTFIATLDQTVVGTAIPRIVADLQGFESITWVTTIYLLTSTVTIPIYGRLSDLFGRKPLFLFCIVLFLIGSGLCGAAQSMPQLIVFRALQGVGAGGLQPIATAVIGDLFPPRERGKWQGLWGSSYALAAIIGPLVGGVLTDQFSWRWVFYVNLPIGVVALLVLIYLMPTLKQRDRRGSIDYIGSGLMIVGSLLLLLGFSWAGSQFAWLSPQIIGLLGSSMLLLTLMVVYCARQEQKGEEPVIEPSLFKKSVRILGVALIASMIIYLALVGSSYFISLFVQGVIGASATNSGLTMMPMMLVSIASSIVGGLLISITGRYKAVAILGVVISLGGFFLLTRLNVESTYMDVVVAMVVMGLGVGAGLTVYTTAVQNALPGKLGQISSLLVYARQIGGSIGLAAMGSFLNASYVPAFHRALPPALGQSIPPKLLKVFEDPLVLLSQDGMGQIRAGFERFGPQGHSAFNTLLGAVKAGLTTSLHDMFVLSMGLMLVGLVVVCFLQEIPLRKREKGEGMMI